MKYVDEGPFLVDNVKSWIHCLLTGCNRATTYTSDSYHYHDYIEMLYVFDTECEMRINRKCHNFVIKR